MSYVLPTILDLMEYANDALAQAAFVTNAGLTYGTDILTGGTASGTDIGGFPPSNACDNDEGTRWIGSPANTAWWKYDSGAGVTKRVRKIRLKINNSPHLYAGTFVFKGSNNDADWTTIYNDTCADTSAWQEFTFVNANSYRYHMLDGLSGYDNESDIYEMELLEATDDLGCYSEATIKQEGTYALKGFADITTSLNKTLTRTVSPVINLTDKTIIKFDIRAGRTGAHIKIGIHDSGGTTTEITPTIVAANTWQTVVWDISAVTNANKDAIDSIIITIVNADAANTFYIDNMFADIIPNYLVHRGRDRFRTAGYSLGN